MRAKGAALMLPFANTDAMQMHLDEISRHVAHKAHGVVLMDRAGWHTTAKLKVPKNLTIILLPSRSPELHPVEEAGCRAWNKLMERPETIMSIGWKDWACVGQ